MWRNRIFSNGEVIRARVISTPWLFHYGIIIVYDGIVYVAHNPFNGGHPHIDTIEEYFNGRIFEKSFGVLTYDTPDVLLERYYAVDHKAYSILFFNCEDFINYMIQRFRFQSGKIQFAAAVLIVTGLIVHYARKDCK